MNWEAIGATGEVLGAIAVLVTLVLLLRQLKQNTSALKNQALNSIYGEWIAMTGELQTQPTLRAAYLKDAAGIQLDDEESMILVVYFIRMLTVNDKAYHLYLEGSADDFNFLNLKRSLIAVLTTSSFFIDWWAAEKWRYSEPFQELIEKEVVSGSGT